VHICFLGWRGLLRFKWSNSTLTTVGGEVMPVSPIARYLSIAESMTGQLFPAILLGALAAMAMQSRAKS
jgi:Ion channel